MRLTRYYNIVSTSCRRVIRLRVLMEDEDVPKPKRPPSDTKQQQHNKPWSFKRFFSSNTEHKNKEYWQNLPLDEKRKQYRCREKYLKLEQIPTWPDFYSKTKCTPAVGDSKYPLNSTLNNKVSIWQGDITRLEIDAIVNAANSSLMGGGGVDGAIHSAAGSSLRDECGELNGCETGDAKITTGHRLPAKFIIHTVGPMNCNAQDLQSCYTRCLQLVLDNNIKSVAFCCIATGVYGFPNDKAAKIALETVRQWLEIGDNADEVDRVIFTVFLKEDYKIYTGLLHHYFPLEENAVSKDEDTTEEKKQEEEEFQPKLVKYATEPMTYKPSNETSTDKGEPKGVTQMETDERGVESNQIDNAEVESNQTENMGVESNQTDNTGVEPNQKDNENIDSNQEDKKGEDSTVNGIEAENDKKLLNETDNKGVTPNEQTQDEEDTRV